MRRWGAVSGTDDAGQVPAAYGRRRRGRRWAAAGTVVVIAVGAGVALVVTDPFSSSSSAGAAVGSSYHTSSAPVTVQSLSSQTPVSATLGKAGSYSVVNQAQGTITALPAVGQVVRQGQVLYAVSGNPVVLLYGTVPAYRDLSEGLTGPDVAELNADLVELRYATSAELGAGSDYFSAATAAALEALQAHLKVTVTGSLTLGQAVFLPSAIQVTALGQNTVLGGQAAAGSALLSASSTRPVVTIALDPSLQSEVRDGEQVSITLPDSQITPGVVSYVSSVATSTSGSGGSGSSGGSTITVDVTPTHPAALGGLDQAPVQVTITTGSVSNALVVPVDALLAQPGGYAVEVTSGRSRRLVAVSLGLFDDAAGKVQVTGPGLSAGQRVVVPAT